MIGVVRGLKTRYVVCLLVVIVSSSSMFRFSSLPLLCFIILHGNGSLLGRSHRAQSWAFIGLAPLPTATPVDLSHRG